MPSIQLCLMQSNNDKSANCQSNCASFFTPRDEWNFFSILQYIHIQI